MFKFIKEKPAIANGSQVIFKISGMHCTACALSIDMELEDLPGVFSATTSYQKMLTQVTYDPDQVSLDKILSTIDRVGYRATVSNP